MDGAVRFWDAETSELRFACKGHTQLVRSVAFSPNDKIVASGSFDGTVLLYNADTGTVRATLPAARGEINCVAFSPDGKMLAVAENERDRPAPVGLGPGEAAPHRRGTISLWDLEPRPSLRAVLKGARGMILTVAFAPDGQSLVSGGGYWTEFGEVIVWDLNSTKFIAYPLASWVECLAFSLDGQTLVSGSGVVEQPSELNFWEVVPAEDGPPALRRAERGRPEGAGI
jgi:WD40 repeat protein